MATKKSAQVSEASGGFRGFGSQALPFLRALRENNDRDWFAANKSTFVEECDTPLRELVGEVGGRLASAGLPLAPIAKSPVFRIYRDVRFSNDKSPYKTNLGAALHRDGDKGRPGMLYIHVEPAASFVAAGFHQPEAPTLKLLREAVADDSARFLRLVLDLEAKGPKLSEGDPLARMPKGFEGHAGSPVAGHIRRRSFIVAQPLADDDLERRDLPGVVAGFARHCTPFLEFFWSKLGE